MADNLKDKVALLTGGTSGIGLEVARQLVARGARVVLAGRSAPQGQAAAQALGGPEQVRFVAADVSQENQVQALVAETLAHFGRLDLLFNNAGAEGTPGPLVETPAQGIEDILATNVTGVLLVLKHALPALLAHGTGVVVNTASYIGTVMPFPVALPYGASKAAVLSITRGLAADPARQQDQLRVFAVCPWTTDTPMIDRLAGGNPKAKQQFATVNPSGQLATAANVAQVVVALFAGEADLPSGEAVLVDHGGATSRVQPMRYE
ncbi:SDR family oxidoreductase [Hymenobacter sp. RP-2-7]|uniref:SDR family oxidoreductase n=1 Tax=Hymenobacter polaris TaxID=2682546 RepID=A0A7Y0ADN6_9BACT|nr:SDR family oxidoreductase [Hymenobacter polaris]NML65180.1 SDR family oxidoreductase [Hymenobacter polaris]